MAVYEATKMYDGLYQGGVPPGGRILSDAGVDTLVLAAKENADASIYNGVKIILAPGEDTTIAKDLKNYVQMWESAAELVAQEVESGKNVLVTCISGYNRSGIIVCMTLCKLTGMTGKQAVEHVQSRRRSAMCNDLFVEYIVEKYK